MKLILTSIACLLCAALVPTTLKQLPQAAAITNFQGRGLDRYTQKTVFGSEVVARVKKLKTKNKGVARAMRDLEKKGLRPALEQSLSVLQIRKPSVSSVRSHRFLKASLQSEAFSEDGYEMTFIPYDDGDPNTWEGVIYEHDESGYEYEYTATFDISGEQETWDRVVESYYPADGSAPVSSDSPEYYDPSYQPYDPMMPQQISQRTSSRKDRRFLRKSLHHAVPQRGLPGARYPVPPHWQDRTRRWLRCSAGSCTASAIGCIASGPGWPVCFKWWCGGSAAGCIILSW